VIWAKSKTKTIKCADFWSRPTPDSKPTTFTASGRCALRDVGLVLQDVHIPNRTSCPNGRLKSPLMCLNQARYGISWAQSARRWRATTARCNIRCFASSGAISHRLASTRPAKAHLDDQRNHQSAIISAASRTLERCRKSAASTHLHGKRNNVWMPRMRRLSRDILGANGVADDYPSCGT